MKAEPCRIQMTVVGGDNLDYPSSTASPAACIIKLKLIVNSVISDHKKYISKFCAIDVKSFFSDNTNGRRGIF